MRKLMHWAEYVQEKGLVTKQSLLLSTGAAMLMLWVQTERGQRVTMVGERATACSQY